MSNSFTKLASLDFHEIFDLVDIVQDNLDDLWKQDEHKPYPQLRMSHLMDTIAAAISRAIQVNLKGKIPNHVIFFSCTYPKSSNKPPPLNKPPPKKSFLQISPPLK